MCQVISGWKTSEWNARVVRLLIVTGLALLAVKSGQSMPSGDFRQSAPSPSSSSASDHGKRGPGEPEESTFIHVQPKFIRDKSNGHDSMRSNAREERPVMDRDALTYPGEWERDERNFIPQPLPNCMGKTFCEDTESEYPQEYFSNIIRRTESLKLFSGTDKIDITVRGDVVADGGELLCGSETKIVYPKTAQNGAKEWLFVLQDQKQGYKQGVKIENCEAGNGEDRSCKIIEDFIYGYKTLCKQKYVSRVLAAVHKNGTAVTENFSMPSSCCCQIKPIGDGVGPRFGGVTPKNQSPAPTKTGRRH